MGLPVNTIMELRTATRREMSSLLSYTIKLIIHGIS
jgi:hypothetical protein